jgi:hypothetical protein
MIDPDRSRLSGCPSYRDEPEPDRPTACWLLVICLLAALTVAGAGPGRELTRADARVIIPAVRAGQERARRLVPGRSAALQSAAV